MKVIDINSTTISEAIKEANKARLQSKNNWYVLRFTQFNIQLKCWDTWIQTSNTGYFNDLMEQSVTQFKQNLENGITYNMNKAK